MKLLPLITCALLASSHVLASPKTPTAAENVHPLSDGVHVDVFDIFEPLYKNDKRSRQQALTLLKNERARPSDEKPLVANLSESQLAHIARALCAYTEGCASLGLYSRAGIALLLSDSNQNFEAALPILPTTFFSTGETKGQKKARVFIRAICKDGLYCTKRTQNPLGYLKVVLKH